VQDKMPSLVIGQGWRPNTKRHPCQWALPISVDSPATCQPVSLASKFMATRQPWHALSLIAHLGPENLCHWLADATKGCNTGSSATRSVVA
jgi:hypothetical protein